MGRGPRRFNLVSTTVLLLLVAGVYGSVIYAPIVWQKTKLDSLIKEESYGARRRGIHEIRQGIMRSAEDQLGILLDEDDIDIDRFPDRVKIYVVWRIQVEHPFIKKITRHIVTLERETVFY